MAAKKKSPAQDLPSQSDPRAPLDGALLLSRSQGLLAELEADLLARARGSEAVREALRARHESERAHKRTADPLEVWERSFVTQVAASWLLSCVFVRTLEDRGLLGHARFAGPGATDSQRLFFEMAPSLTERDYLLAVFRELSHLSAARDLFDPKKNPVWLLGPSAALAKKLLELFRSPSAEAPGLRFGQADTRFLGDLYQDLSADVRERFALLQTPHFVEKYILDRTLERSISRFGLDETSLIDPTCGSGHFLLGAFERLFDHRLRKEPGLDVREAARRALDAVYGSDINPYAVAIARFRLTLAFLEKAGYRKLADSPELPLHLVVGDSLLHAPLQSHLADVAGQSKHAWEGSAMYALEDEEAAKAVLLRKYTVVVGNPPYITVKDATLRERYREMYPRSAAGKYSVAAPFTERFFLLAKTAAFVGMITANSFMKREFGKKLIEQFLPTVNLDGVVNTSGAYIPGHGTPTVLLFGTNEPKQSDEVLTVLAKRGEPSTPEDPEQGLVWRSIADHGDEVGFDNDYVSVANVARTTLEKHPWSLGGGGAAELKELLEERAERRLGDLTDSIGFMAITGEDEAFARPLGAWLRSNAERDRLFEFGIGEGIRDWTVSTSSHVFFPYRDAKLMSPDKFPRASATLWPLRRHLLGRPDFGGKKYIDVGRTWHELHQVPLERLRTPLSITFPFVATHNHFVLDRGGKVFNRTAPIIKLKEGATEEDHLALLAYLNSSTACFWLKQVMSPKGMHNGSESNATSFLVRFEFDGTKLSTLPMPPNFGRAKGRLADLARRIDELLKVSHDSAVQEAAASASPDQALAEHRRRCEAAFRKAIALQDEVDWLVYSAFDITKDEDTSPPAELQLGQRPFEIFLARHGSDAEKTWFRWHETIAETATKTPSVEKRIANIALHPELRLLEAPEAKRRWRQPSGKAAQQLTTVDSAVHEAIDSWLRNRIERNLQTRNQTWRLSEAASTMGTDPSYSAMASVGTFPGFVEVIAEESVPFLAAYRHTEAGLEKRASWERVWDLQRAEDRGETVPPFDPAPKYDQKDYRDANAWRLRGKLDVPKERFISYPGCESDQDKEPVYGWAGWNHLEQAQALAALYQNRKTEEGWDKDRLTPLLAGLLELVPWVKQWHNAPSDEFGGLRLGDYFETFLDGECHTLGLTREALRAFRPAEKTRGRPGTAGKAGKAAKPSEDEAEDADLESSPVPAEKKPRGRKKAAVGESG